MKFIRRLPHPDLDISLYEWNQKFILKIERDGLEQTYKIASEEVEGPGEVERALKQDFIARVSERFEAMAEDWHQALGLSL